MEEGVGVLERSNFERDQEVAALFDRHYRAMCRLAFVILGDAAVAEEIVMDALVKTFSGWRRVRDVHAAEAYLRKAVVNGCRSKIRRKAVETRAAAVLRRTLAAPARQWDAESHETNRLVWAAVGALPDRQRACVVLRYFEDLSEVQIADVLDCSTGTVKSQLSKARAKLESRLGATLEGGAS